MVSTCVEFRRLNTKSLVRYSKTNLAVGSSSRAKSIMRVVLVSSLGLTTYSPFRLGLMSMRCLWNERLLAPYHNLCPFSQPIPLDPFLYCPPDPPSSIPFGP